MFRAMRRCTRVGLLATAIVTVAACQRQSGHEPGETVRTDGPGLPADGGAVSAAPVAPVLDSVEVPPLAQPRPLNWSTMQLTTGKASISCDLDYQGAGDGQTIEDFSRAGLRKTLAPCADSGVMRVRFEGKIDADFTAVIERVTTVADELKLEKRVLDLNSAGGMIEDAIRAGDFIAESRWNIWVREGSICHSACVLILSAGDRRMIAGQVGIHRIIRMSSTATSRAELNQELHVVYGHVRDYFERNGAAVAVADLMRAVPNRSLRLLSSDELQFYGLDGINPAQDDLDRLQLMRQCGEDFVRRRDAFERAFERRCVAADDQLDELNACGLALRSQFGFPDQICPADSPFSEFDTARAANGAQRAAIEPERATVAEGNADSRETPAKDDAPAQ